VDQEAHWVGHLILTVLISLPYVVDRLKGIRREDGKKVFVTESGAKICPNCGHYVNGETVGRQP